MESPSEGGLNSPIPLSQARSKRESRASKNTSEDDRLRALLSEVVSESIATTLNPKMIADVVDKQVSQKLERLENSINRMLDHIDGVRSGEAEDAALRVTTDHSAADLALVGVSLPREHGYPYTCGMLAEKLGTSKHHVLQMIKQFSLRHDEVYHDVIDTGVNSSVQKWSEAAFIKMKEALESGQYQLS